MKVTLSVSLKINSFFYNVALSAEDEILVIFGASGAGKSLTLRMIAGLTKPLRGFISIDNTTVFNSSYRIDVPPQKRKVGYVAQGMALFNHMSVEKNIMFGAIGTLQEKKKRTDYLVSLLELKGMERRMPLTLSGGQAQRTALARALAPRSKVLLLDEPFNSLDHHLRQNMRMLLIKIKQEMNIPILMVTHSLEEAYLLADKIAVIDKGKLLHLDEKKLVFNKPNSSRVARLLGFANIITSKVAMVEPQGITVYMLGQQFLCGSWSGNIKQYSVGDTVYTAIRAEHIQYYKHAPEKLTNSCKAIVTQVFGNWVNNLLIVKVQTGESLEVNTVELTKVGNTCTLYLQSEKLHVVSV